MMKKCIYTIWFLGVLFSINCMQLYAQETTIHSLAQEALEVISHSHEVHQKPKDSHKKVAVKPAVKKNPKSTASVAHVTAFDDAMAHIATVPGYYELAQAQKPEHVKEVEKQTVPAIAQAVEVSKVVEQAKVCEQLMTPQELLQKSDTHNKRIALKTALDMKQVVHNPIPHSVDALAMKLEDDINNAKHTNINIEYNQEIEPETAPRKVYLGPAYNYAMIEDDAEKHFSIPVSIYGSFTFKAFDQCKNSVPLAQSLLGVPSFTIGDIFLESRLSAKVVGAPSNNAGILFLENAGPGLVVSQSVAIPKFGNLRLQQFLALLAPVQVNLSTDVYEFGGEASFIWRGYIDSCKKIAAAAGIIIPLIGKVQTTSLSFENGTLYQQVEQLARDATIRETTIGRFFNSYSGLEDFFIRAVLEPKGLSLPARQNKFGIGNISIFGLIDLAPLIPCFFDGLQVGVNLSFPTGGKAKGGTLFELVLDEGGGVQVEPFFNMILNSGYCFFNPSFYTAVNVSTSFNTAGSVRIPKLVTHVQVNVDPSNPGALLANNFNRVTNIPGLVAPTMTEFFALSFSELDSLVPAFADSAPNSCLKRGTRFITGFGNYFYDLFCCNSRLGIFYDITTRGKDTIKLKANQCMPACNVSTTANTTASAVPLSNFNCSALNCTKQITQRVGFNMTYKFPCGECNFGGQFVVAGKNVPKINELFASFIAIF